MNNYDEVRPINANRLLYMLSGDRTVYSKRAIIDLINSCPTLVTQVTREEIERFMQNSKTYTGGKTSER